ncbi:MAG: hypothetical protein WC619_04860 [Patescibacteria group bacterium]
MKEEKKDELKQLVYLAQCQFILEAKKNGMSSEDVRKILNLNNNKLFKIWKLIKIKNK